jgi:hypothetical protein
MFKSCEMWELFVSMLDSQIRKMLRLRDQRGCVMSRTTVFIALLALSAILPNSGSPHELRRPEAPYSASETATHIYYLSQQRDGLKETEHSGNVYAQLVGGPCGQRRDGDRCSCGPSCDGKCRGSVCQPLTPQDTEGAVSFGTECYFKPVGAPCGPPNGHGKCTLDQKCM